jgi:hypothetical protein
MTPNELTPDLAALIEATSIFLATARANGQRRDVRCWHLANMAIALSDVRFRG